MNKYFAFVIVLFLACTGLQAQDAITLEASGAALNVVYRNESTFGILAHSNGFGLNYRRAKHVTANRKRVFEVELVNMSHPKEVKTYDGQFDNSKGLSDVNGITGGYLGTVFI